MGGGDGGDGGEGVGGGDGGEGVGAKHAGTFCSLTKGISLTLLRAQLQARLEE